MKSITSRGSEVSQVSTSYRSPVLVEVAHEKSVGVTRRTRGEIFLLHLQKDTSPQGKNKERKRGGSKKKKKRRKKKKRNNRFAPVKANEERRQPTFVQVLLRFPTNRVLELLEGRASSVLSSIFLRKSNPTQQFIHTPARRNRSFVQRFFFPVVFLVRSFARLPSF